MTTRTKKILLGLAASHLLLVLLGASQIKFSRLPEAIGLPLDLYSNLSGADSSFAFFSPGVGSDLRARFEVIDRAGNAREVALVEKNREAELKIGNIISRFRSAGHDANLRRTLTASWAGKIFARYPEAQAVVVQLEEYRLVSSEAYRNGQRSAWKLFYRGKFRANKAA